MAAYSDLKCRVMFTLGIHEIDQSKAVTQLSRRCSVDVQMLEVFVSQQHKSIDKSSD